MTWEVFSKQRAPKPYNAYFSPTLILYVEERAVAKIGEYFVYAYNSELDSIGLLPSTKDDPRSYQFKKVTKRRWYKASAVAFLNLHRLKPTEQRYILEKRGEYWVLAPLPTITPRPT